MPAEAALREWIPMRLQEITDPEDPRLDDFRRLTDVALRRVQEPAGGLYIAESAKVISRACAAGHVPRAVMTQRRWLEGIHGILGDDDTPVYLVPDEVAEAVTGYVVHRGALASMHRPSLPPVAEIVADASLVLVLEDIIDHSTMANGNVMRHAG